MKHFLKNSGLKITKPRLQVLYALKNAKNKHVSAEDLFNLLKSRGEKLALATIYRVLSQFEGSKIVIKHNFEDERRSIFELILNDGHHDHLICIKCSKVIEFTDSIIEKQLNKIAKKYKFNILQHTLSIRGMCGAC